MRQLRRFRIAIILVLTPSRRHLKKPINDVQLNRGWNRASREVSFIFHHHHYLSFVLFILFIDLFLLLGHGRRNFRFQILLIIVISYWFFILSIDFSLFWKTVKWATAADLIKIFHLYYYSIYMRAASGYSLFLTYNYCHYLR